MSAQTKRASDTPASPPTTPAARPAWRRTIGFRLRWSYLISSTLPLIVVGGLLIFLHFRSLQHSVYNEHMSHTAQAVREISSYTAGFETALLSMGQQMNATSSADEWEHTARDLINTSFPNVLDIVVYQPNGSEVVHLTSKRSFPADLHERETDHPLVLLALNGLGRRSTIYQTEQGQLVFDMALPLRNQSHEQIGAIKATISATPIEQSLRILGRDTNSVLMLVDRKTGEVMLRVSEQTWSPPPDIASLLAQDSPAVRYVRDNTRALIYRSGSGETVLGVAAPIPPGSWEVVIEKPIQRAFGNVYMTMVLLTVLVGLVGLIGLGWGLLQASQIQRPLQALHAGAEAFGDGQLNHRIRVQSRDEMGQLADTFNEMAERLQASLTEIEAQNHRLLEGLRLARDIQMGLLPSHPPWDHNYLSVYACSVPASEVGGDFYSYIALPSGDAAISIGDISGKGVGAALFMALTSSMLEAQVRAAINPSQVFCSLNRILHPRLKLNKMNAALLYAVFDIHNDTMTVANAGMIAPVLLRQPHRHTPPANYDHDSLHGYHYQFLDVCGLPIGSMPNAVYHETTLALQPGDTLLFISDGVVEALNAQGDMLGFEGLGRILDDLLLAQGTQIALTTLVDNLFARVRAFVGSAEQHDDITIVAVRPTVSIESDATETHKAAAPTSYVA